MNFLSRLFCNYGINGNHVESHADFSRILLGDMKAVLIVVRPVKSVAVRPELSPRTPLLDIIGTVTGTITLSELLNAFFTAPRLMIEEIGKAGSAAALHHSFLDCRKMAVSMLLGHADPYAISLFVSAIADAICQRVLNLIILSIFS